MKAGRHPTGDDEGGKNAPREGKTPRGQGGSFDQKKSQKRRGGVGTEQVEKESTKKGGSVAGLLYP